MQGSRLDSREAAIHQAQSRDLPYVHTGTTGSPTLDQKRFGTVPSRCSPGCTTAARTAPDDDEIVVIARDRSHGSCLLAEMVLYALQSPRS